MPFLVMDIKQKYRRFRQWQQEPFNYGLKSEAKQHCANCHQDYTGNFCPFCSQKAGIGKVTWSSVAKSISLIWGMDSRSLPYSLVQLLLRPGYLIRDYITGERQSSFPPVKMLLLVAIVYELIIHWTGLRRVPSDPERDFEFMREFAIWFKNNPGWGQMIKCAFLILPTWLLFRYSPRNSRHSLPEGIYIQVFMTTLVLMIMIVTETFLGDWFYLVVLFYYIIAYHQLFGYGWWGSIWRTVLTGFEGFFLLLTLFMAVESIYGKPFFEESILNWSLVAIIILINVAILVACYYISRYTSQRAAKQVMDSLPEPPDNESLEDEVPDKEPQQSKPADNNQNKA